MAKYIVNHICGHRCIEHINGTEMARRERMAYLETQPCINCRKLYGKSENRKSITP